MLTNMPPTKTLLVMRHAKSSWKTNEPDKRRPLSGRGTRDAVVAGQFIAPLTVDMVWCSSATRTQQTWQCARMGGAAAGEVRVSDELYGASGDELLEQLRETPASAATVLLIGHEPGVSELVGLLAVHSELRDAAEAHFPTSGLAVLGLAGDWDELTPGSASMVAFEIPRG